MPLLVGLYCVLTLLLIARVPIGAAPDEGPHLDYVEYLATRRALPVFQAAKAPDYGYEFHQPPLYYALCAPLWKATGTTVRPYLCRLVSLLCGALTLVLLWHSVVALFPHNRGLALVATSFAALWPLHQAVGASASNDALAGLICAAIFFIIARAATQDRGWQMRDVALLGVLIGLGLLTKTTCLVVGMVAVGAAWHVARLTSNSASDKGAAFRAAAVVTGVALLIGGWWLVRNQILYGDPLALGIFNAAFAQSSPGPAVFFAGGVSVLTYLRALLLILFCTAWGIFGGPNTAITVLNPFGVRGPSPAVLPALGPMLICAVATVAAVWGLWRWTKAWRSLPPASRVALAWWVIGFCLVALAWIQFNTRYFQAQARYFHPALLPMALAAALGWWHVFPVERRSARWLGVALLGATLLGLTLWNVFGWRTLV